MDQLVVEGSKILREYPITRGKIQTGGGRAQPIFADIETGVEELSQNKLPELLKLKYHTLYDAKEFFGGLEGINIAFINFQKHLYEQRVSL